MSGGDWKTHGAFLKREELPAGVTLALLAVRETRAGDRKLYVAGGQQLDRKFLATLVLPAGMRVLLYRDLDPQFLPGELIGSTGPVSHAFALQPLINQVRTQHREAVSTLDQGPGRGATGRPARQPPCTSRPAASGGGGSGADRACGPMRTPRP